MLHSIIVAVSENNVIGNENKLLWNLPVQKNNSKKVYNWPRNIQINNRPYRRSPGFYWKQEKIF